MIKCDNKLVEAYVLGKEISEHTLEELENDYHFMMKVITYTNDKKMYDMCSDEVKNTYQFIKFMINKFRDDKDFICNIADEYLDNEREEANRIEILLIICNFLDKNNSNYISYNLQLEAIYTVKRFNIDAFKQTKEAQDILSIIQLGFYFIIDSFNHSDIIMKYFAKKFIIDIFNELNLEQRVHAEFNSFQDLESIGLNTYLINLLSLYDTNLSSYVGCHLELLNNLKKELNTIKKRWDFYILSMESIKYHSIIELVHKYTEEHENCPFTETEALYYIAKELGIADKIAEYDNIGDGLYEDIIKSLKDSTIKIAKENNDLTVLSYYVNLKKAIINILNPSNKPKQQDNKDTSKGNILVFKPKK